MLSWIIAVLLVFSAQATSSQSHLDKIINEYSFGLSQFQRELNTSLINVIEAEINFLSQNINVLIFKGETLMHQSMNLFETYGFIVDAKNVYLFVANVRERIKTNINLLIQQYSAPEIKRKLERIYRNFVYDLHFIVEKEISQIENAVALDGELIECWENYKVLLLELGLDAVGDMTTLAVIQTENLGSKTEEVKKEIFTMLSQLIGDLSKTYSSIFLTRLKVDSYIEANQEKILDQIDGWFTQIGTSLQQATKNVQLGANKIIQEANGSFEYLSREIVDCIAVE